MAKHGHSRDGKPRNRQVLVGVVMIDGWPITHHVFEGLARHHGYRYYTWVLKGGTFQFFEHPVHLAQEQAVEGKYLIQTEEPTLSPVEAVAIYKELSEVERAFAELKDVIEMREETEGLRPRHLVEGSVAAVEDRSGRRDRSG